MPRFRDLRSYEEIASVGFHALETSLLVTVTLMAFFAIPAAILSAFHRIFHPWRIAISDNTATVVIRGRVVKLVVTKLNTNDQQVIEVQGLLKWRSSNAIDRALQRRCKIDTALTPGPSIYLFPVNPHTTIDTAYVRKVARVLRAKLWSRPMLLAPKSPRFASKTH